MFCVCFSKNGLMTISNDVRIQQLSEALCVALGKTPLAGLLNLLSLCMIGCQYLDFNYS